MFQFFFEPESEKTSYLTSTRVEPLLRVFVMDSATNLQTA